MFIYRYVAVVLGTIALLLTGWACGDRVSDTALHGAQPVSGAEIWRPPPTSPPEPPTKTPVQRPVGIALATLVPDPVTTTSTTTTTTTFPPSAVLEPVLPDLFVVAEMIEELRVYLDLPDDRVYMARPPEPPQFTLEMLVGYFFHEEDREWALHVAFCESSGQPDDISSDARHRSSRASGWFQHLPKFWDERSEASGFDGVDIMDPVANVGVAAYLLYQTPQGKGHWSESKACWG